MLQSSWLLQNVEQLHEVTVRGKKNPATLKCLFFNSQYIFLWKMVLVVIYYFHLNEFGKIHPKSQLK